MDQIRRIIRENFHAEFVRKESGLTLFSALLVTHGYIRNAAVLKEDCKVYLVIDVEGVWMVSRTSQKC